MGFFSKIFGRRKRQPVLPPPPRITQAPTMSPSQKSAMDAILKLSLENIKDPQKGFEPIAQEARTRFSKETIPSLAERFTSMGTGAQRGSGFQGALTAGATGLEELLASLSTEYGTQRLGQYGNLAGLGARPQFENITQKPIMQEREPGLMQNFMGMGMAYGAPRIFKGLSGLFRRF